MLGKLEQRVYEITRKSFIEYFFEYGSDQEVKEHTFYLGMSVIVGLKQHERVTFNLTEMWEKVEKVVIPSKFFKGMSANNFDDISEYMCSVDTFKLTN